MSLNLHVPVRSGGFQNDVHRAKDFKRMRLRPGDRSYVVEPQTSLVYFLLIPSSRLTTIYQPYARTARPPYLG